jgi:hypothetical protein
VDLVVILKGALPPVLSALVLVSLAGVRLLPLGMSIGVFVAYCLLKGTMPPLPLELWEDPNGSAWLVWGVILEGMISLLEHYRMVPPRLAVSVSVAGAALATWLMLLKVSQRWSAGDVVAFVGGGCLVSGLLVIAVRTTIARAAATVFPAILFVLVLSLDAALVTLGKSAFLGQLCGATAGALGAAVGTVLWRRGFALRKADGVWIGSAHALFLLAGVHLAYLDWLPAILALVAPLLLLCLPRALASSRPFYWSMAALPLVLVPLGVALWLAQPEASPYGY